MNISFQVELYDEMIGQPFTTDDYLACRLIIFVQENGKKYELCNSTFHDAILLDIGYILLELLKEKSSFRKSFETFENAMEYTLQKNGNMLIITSYSHFDSTIKTIYQGMFEHFYRAFFKEYERYFKGLFKLNPNAIQHDSVKKMEQQLKTYKGQNNFN